MTGAGIHVASRGPFDGVIQILRYNWTQYAAAAIVVFGGAALLAAIRPSRLVATAAWSGIALAAAWAAASLVVSYVVYDRSSLYRWTWLDRIFPAAPRRWVTVHAGLDESTAALSQRFGATPIAVLDIFDPSEMTESSIARARRGARDAPPATASSFSALPVDDRACDAVMIVLAAHELRRASARHRFFIEVKRILAPDGVAVVVEHLRGPANFAAFGPGVMHFHSRRTWLRTFSDAQFSVSDAFRITPFVAVFVLTPEIGGASGRST